MLNCCQFQQCQYILDCIGNKYIDLLEQDALFIIKAAKYMKKDFVMFALKEMFVFSGNPFSISIHNDRGRYWLKPSDAKFQNQITHNKMINWKPYRGEPE